MGDLNGIIGSSRIHRPCEPHDPDLHSREELTEGIDKELEMIKDYILDKLIKDMDNFNLEEIIERVVNKKLNEKLLDIQLRLSNLEISSSREHQFSRDWDSYTYGSRPINDTLMSKEVERIQNLLNKANTIPSVTSSVSETIKPKEAEKKESFFDKIKSQFKK